MADEPRLLGRLPKAADLEIAIRLHESDGRRILEFVDHVPSLDLYGRGYWIPLTDDAIVEDLLDALAGLR